jgi:hypothetical protein
MLARISPTIGELRAVGLRALWVACSNPACHERRSWNFEELRLASLDKLPDLEESLRFVCTRCQGRIFNLSPDWRGQASLETREKKIAPDAI